MGTRWKVSEKYVTLFLPKGVDIGIGEYTGDSSCGILNNMENMYEDSIRDFTKFCNRCSEPCEDLREYYFNGGLCNECSEDEDEVFTEDDSDEEYDLDSMENDCNCFYCAGILSSKFGRE